MITILPTTDSLLDHDAYKVVLASELDMHRARAKKIANTLSGIPVTTLWRKSRVGAFKNITVTISLAQYKVLKKIVYHATVFEWLVMADDDRYNCSVDITLAKTVMLNGSKDWKEVNIGFSIVSIVGE